MKLTELIRSLNINGLRGDIDIQIKGVSYNSRNVKPGDLFIAIKGFETDGHLFIEDAIEKGASALLIEDKNVWNNSAVQIRIGRDIPLCLVPDTRFAMAVVADRFYDHPSKKMRIIGVTGTNGKTTTCTLIANILEKSGEKVGLLTTLSYKIDKNILPSQRTTPESLDLQRLLSDIVNAGCGWSVIEVSSHSLILERISSCELNAALLTNMTQDHLDFHKTKGEYYKAKARIFDLLDKSPHKSLMDKVAVLNSDDLPSQEIILKRQSQRPMQQSVTITYGVNNEADVMARDIEEYMDGLRFKAVTPWGNLFITSPLIGKPNIYNILAAITVTMSFGMNSENVLEGIKATQGVPGRFEKIKLGQPFDVIVDYAHTEDALAQLLSVVRRLSRGRLICVFGCGGDRDRSKRPLMGKAAARGSDWTIITSDNPRSEAPSSIIEEIEGGFLKEKSSAGYEICSDRKEAISRAICMAGPGDTVIIAGKGHETTQLISGKVFQFDDREVAQQAIVALMTGETKDGNDT